MIALFRLSRSMFEVVTLLSMVIQVSACTILTNKTSPTVRFILPDGYRGAFQLVLDDKEGVDVIEHNRAYTYEIPKTGLLRVKSFKPFEEPHLEIAVYKSGQNIPMEDSTVSSDTIALRALGTSRHNDGPLTQTNVIGTKEQAAQAQRDEMNGKLKLGSIP